MYLPEDVFRKVSGRFNRPAKLSHEKVNNNSCIQIQSRKELLAETSN